MGLLNLFISNGGASDEEVALFAPDEMEAKSLAHHTKRCALRYKLFTKRQSAQSGQLARVELLVLGFGLYLVLVSEPARSLLKLIGIQL